MAHDTGVFYMSHAIFLIVETGSLTLFLFSWSILINMPNLTSALFVCFPVVMISLILLKTYLMTWHEGRGMLSRGYKLVVKDGV